MIFLLSGMILLLLVLRDVFQTVIVPRGTVTSFHIATPLVRSVIWPPFRYVTSKVESPIWKAELLGWFGPFVVMLLLTVWMSLLILAFSLISYSVATEYSPALDSFPSAIYVAGSSVLTLGLSDFSSTSIKVRILILASAFIGMVLTASVVSLLFTLIASLQRREVLASLTSNVAGTPPAGIAILETYESPSGRKSLDGFYDDWHCWCADISETHKAYPILVYFRSTDPYSSWLTALGAVLDSTALLLSVNPQTDCVQATLAYRFGCRVVDDLIEHWNLRFEHAADSSGDEFSGLYKRLNSTAYCSVDETTAEANFNQLRQEYAGKHQALCKYLLLPPAPLFDEYKLRRPLAEQALTIDGKQEGPSVSYWET